MVTIISKLALSMVHLEIRLRLDVEVMNMWGGGVGMLEVGRY